MKDVDVISELKFDLLKLEINPNALPQQTWLLLTKQAKLPEKAPFLLSLAEDHPAYDTLSSNGDATSLKQAHGFFKQAIEGDCAISIFPRVVAHLRDIQGFDPETGLAKERKAFAAQFDSQTPKLGLQGFLNKTAKRFPVDPKHRRELLQALAWLEPQL